MKLRIRFQSVTKVLVIEEDQQDRISLTDVKQSASQLFQKDFNADFSLSLNGKEFIEDETVLLSNCDVVSGDLLFVLSKTAPQDVPACTTKPKLLSSENSLRTSTLSSTDQHDKRTCSENCKTGKEHMVGIEQQCTSQSPVAGPSSEQHWDLEDIVDHGIVNQCLSEPILCRESCDGRVPLLLLEAYEALKPEVEAETLCVVLHVLMLETGFIICPESTEREHSCHPDKWRHPGYYKFTYSYPGCMDNTVSLTIIPTGNSLAVHGKVVCDDSATRMCSLRPTDFVTAASTGPVQCYQQLPKLNMLFKDSIANLLVQDIRQGLEDVFGLLALTLELKLRVLSFLSARDLLKISLVNSEMAEISRDPYLWRRLYMKEFGNRRDNSLSQDWKHLYVQEYKARKERRKCMSRMMMTTPSWGPSRNPHNPAPWLPPNPGGIIGGDYDLYPNFPNLPGAHGRGGQPPFMMPRPRYDLIGPSGVNPNPDPDLLPRRPSGGRGMGTRPNPFGGGFFPNFF